MSNVASAATAGGTSAAAATKSDQAATLATSNAKQSKSTSSEASGQTDVVQLSDQAKAVLAKAVADQAATTDLTLSFDEILTKRTDALSAKLSTAF